MSRGLVGVVVALLLVIAACSSSDTASSTTNTPPVTAATLPPTSTTTTTTITTTTVETTEPATASTIVPDKPDVLISNFNRESLDDFDTTGDDLYRVVVELYDLFNYLEGIPGPDANAMVNLVFEEDFPQRSGQLENFEELTANAWRYSDPGVELIAVEIHSVGSTTATATVVTTREDQVLVDSDGNAVKLYEGWEPQISTLLLTRPDSGGRWRIAEVLSPPTPSGSGDLQEMAEVDWSGR